MTNGENRSALPRGWVSTRLEEMAEIIQGQSPPSSTYNEVGHGLPFYQGKLEFSKTYPTPRKWCTAPRKIAETGDVLISVRAPVGPTNVCPAESCIGRGLAAVRGLGDVQTLFILYLLRAYEQDLSGQGTGTTFNAISGDQLRGLVVPLPPLPEQRRIVAKIEELLTRLDAGVEALKIVKLQLKRYRQSVLKSAFEGKLTREWREAHKGQLELASVLLERIRQERRKQGKYKELPPLVTSALPELPEGWAWARIGDIAESMKNGIYKPATFYRDNGTACLRMYNIQDGSIVWKDIKRMTLSQEEIDEYGLKADDILINRVNSRELVGKAAVIRSGLEECVYESKNIRLRLCDKAISSYVSFWFQVYGQDYFNRNAQQTVGMASINQEQITLMPLPFPTTTEQPHIVAEADRLFSIADEVETTVDQTLAQSDRLRQSILKQAFEGRLVSQDPTDEPAVELLERIRAERVRAQSGGDDKAGKRYTERLIKHVC